MAEAAEQVASEMRSCLTPNEVSLEFGLKVSGELNWWFFAKAQGEGIIKVTPKWTDRHAHPYPTAEQPAADQPSADPTASDEPAGDGP